MTYFLKKLYKKCEHNRFGVRSVHHLVFSIMQIIGPKSQSFTQGTHVSMTTKDKNRFANVRLYFLTLFTPETLLFRKLKQFFLVSCLTFRTAVHNGLSNGYISRSNGCKFLRNGCHNPFERVMILTERIPERLARLLKWFEQISQPV